MENVYYTPKIEEFHIGFEFEEFDYIGKNNEKTWNNVVTDWTMLDWLCDDWEHKQEEWKDNYRVKYLNQEDIESFGFIFKSSTIRNWYELEIYGDFPISNHRFQKVSLQHDFRNLNQFGIKIECTLAGDNQIDTVFEGFCKNKSELKKILQMLNLLESS